MSHLLINSIMVFSPIYQLKFFKDLFIFRERYREGERKRDLNVQEIHRSVASCTPPSGDLACNPGMCPDWESNQWPYGSQADTQFTEQHQPGQSTKFSWPENVLFNFMFLKKKLLCFFYYHLISLYPLPKAIITILLPMSMSPFFLLNSSNP